MAVTDPVTDTPVLRNTAILEIPPTVTIAELLATGILTALVPLAIPLAVLVTVRPVRLAPLPRIYDPITLPMALMFVAAVTLPLTDTCVPVRLAAFTMLVAITFWAFKLPVKLALVVAMVPTIVPMILPPLMLPVADITPPVNMLAPVTLPLNDICVPI